MSPKEKAKELVDKMSIDFDMCRGQNIQCAIIAVDELIKYTHNNFMEKYWQQVKHEIKQL